MFTYDEIYKMEWLNVLRGFRARYEAGELADVKAQYLCRTSGHLTYEFVPGTNSPTVGEWKNERVVLVGAPREIVIATSGLVDVTDPGWSTLVRKMPKHWEATWTAFGYSWKIQPTPTNRVNSSRTRMFIACSRCWLMHKTDWWVPTGRWHQHVKGCQHKMCQEELEYLGTVPPGVGISAGL